MTKEIGGIKAYIDVEDNFSDVMQLYLRMLSQVQKQEQVLIGTGEELERQQKDLIETWKKSIQEQKKVRRGNDELSQSFSNLAKHVTSIFNIKNAYSILAATISSTVSESNKIENAKIGLERVLPATEDINKALSEADRIAGKYGEDVGKVINVMQMWAQQGKNLADTIYLTETATKAYVTGELANTETAVSRTTSIMNQFNMKVEDATHLWDAMNKLGKETPTSVDFLSEAMINASSSANEAGVSFEKTLGILTVLKKAGYEAEEAGNAVSVMLSQMKSVDVEKALNGIKDKLTEQPNLFRDIEKVLDELAVKWDSLTDSEQENISKAIAGAEQYELFISIMEDWNTVLDATTKAQNSAGTMQEEMTKAMQAYTKQVDRVNTQIEILKRKVGDTVKVNFFRTLLEEVHLLLKWINQLDEQELTQLLNTLGKIGKTSGVLILITQFNKLKKPLTTLTSGVFEFSKMLIRAARGVRTHANSQKYLQRVLKMTRLSIISLKTIAMEFLLPLLAIEAAIWAISKAWDHFTGKAEEALKPIEELEQQSEQMSEYATAISEAENALIRLRNEKAELARQNKDTSDIEAQIEATQEEIEKNEELLEQQKQQLQNKIVLTKQNIAEKEDKIKQLEEEKTSTQKEIDDINAGIIPEEIKDSVKKAGGVIYGHTAEDLANIIADDSREHKLPDIDKKIEKQQTEISEELKLLNKLVEQLEAYNSDDEDDDTPKPKIGSIFIRNAKHDAILAEKKEELKFIDAKAKIAEKAGKTIDVGALKSNVLTSTMEALLKEGLNVEHSDFTKLIKERTGYETKSTEYQDALAKKNSELSAAENIDNIYAKHNNEIQYIDALAKLYKTWGKDYDKTNELLKTTEKTLNDLIKAGEDTNSERYGHLKDQNTGYHQLINPDWISEIDNLEKKFKDSLDSEGGIEVLEQSLEENIKDYRNHYNSLLDLKEKYGEEMKKYDEEHGTDHFNKLQEEVRTIRRELLQLDTDLTKTEMDSFTESLKESYHEEIKLINDSNASLEEKKNKLEQIKAEIEGISNKEIRLMFIEEFGQILDENTTGYKKQMEFGNILSEDVTPESLQSLNAFLKSLEEDKEDFTYKNELIQLVKDTIDQTGDHLVESAKNSGEQIINLDQETFGARKQKLAEFYAEQLLKYEDNEEMKKILLELYHDQELELIEKQNEMKLILSEQFHEAYNQIVNAQGDEIGKTIKGIFKKLLIDLALQNIEKEISGVFSNILPSDDPGNILHSLAGAFSGILVGGLMSLIFPNEEEEKPESRRSSGWSYSPVNYAQPNNQYAPPITNESSKIFYFNTYIQSITTEAANKLVSNEKEFERMWNKMHEKAGRRMLKGIT